MTDAQLRDKILKWFYEHRSEGDCHVDPSRFSDIPAGLRDAKHGSGGKMCFRYFGVLVSDRELRLGEQF